MAVFVDPWQTQPIDWLILQNGYVQKYFKEEILNADIKWFQEEKYHIIEFDCRVWTNNKAFHDDLKQKLKFPDYYGGNYDALNDCLSDLEFPETGILFVFRHLDFYAKEEAQRLLDLCSRNSRYYLLFGNRLITLIQIDYPDIEYTPTGACSVLWNGTEWIDSQRKP